MPARCRYRCSTSTALSGLDTSQAGQAERVCVDLLPAPASSGNGKARWSRVHRPAPPGPGVGGDVGRVRTPGGPAAPWPPATSPEPHGSDSDPGRRRCRRRTIASRESSSADASPAAAIPASIRLRADRGPDVRVVIARGPAGRTRVQPGRRRAVPPVRCRGTLRQAGQVAAQQIRRGRAWCHRVLVTHVGGYAYLGLASPCWLDPAAVSWRAVLRRRPACPNRAGDRRPDPEGSRPAAPARPHRRQSRASSPARSRHRQIGNLLPCRIGWRQPYAVSASPAL